MLNIVTLLYPARIASLENTVYQLTEYIQREGIQVSENGVDFVQQARDGEEKDDKSRAIYEKDLLVPFVFLYLLLCMVLH